MRNEKLVIKIIEKCIKLNSLGQDSFFRFSGHVKEISIEVCKKKWKNIDMSKYKDYGYGLLVILINAKHH